MNIELMDAIPIVQRKYIKTRLKAERSCDPKAVARISEAQKQVARAEKEADRTMDPVLQERTDRLFSKLKTLLYRT